MPYSDTHERIRGIYITLAHRSIKKRLNIWVSSFSPFLSLATTFSFPFLNHVLCTRHIFYTFFFLLLMGLLALMYDGMEGWTAWHGHWRERHLRTSGTGRLWFINTPTPTQMNGTVLLCFVWIPIRKVNEVNTL